MDNSSAKLLDSPHNRSHKTVYLVLVLVLVVAVSVLAFLKTNMVEIPGGDSNLTLTLEEQTRRLEETPSTGTNPSREEQERRLRESPSTNENAKNIAYEEQLETLKNN